MSRLYSNLKFLRYSDRLSALIDGIPAAPVHVRIKPTNRCNQRCWYCAYRNDNMQLGADMNEADQLAPEVLLGIADDIVAMGVKAVTFSGGGEPLLHKHLPEAVTRLAEGGVHVATLTNGTNLKGAMADVFAQYGAWVRVSLDGWDDASYEAARGVPEGAFTQLLGNLSRFAARNSTCVLGASVIVSETNAPHLSDLCATLKSVGISHVKLSAAVVANDREENNRYHRRIHAKVMDEIAAARSNEASDFTILDHYHELDDRFEKTYKNCAFNRYLTVIGADGGIYTCQDKAYTATGQVAVLNGRSFYDVWFDPETQSRLQGLDPSAVCRHHCVAHSKNLVLDEILSVDKRHVAFV